MKVVEQNKCFQDEKESTVTSLSQGSHLLALLFLILQASKNLQSPVDVVPMSSILTKVAKQTFFPQNFLKFGRKSYQGKNPELVGNTTRVWKDFHPW